MVTEESTAARHLELVNAYFKLIDAHLSDLAAGRQTEISHGWLVDYRSDDFRQWQIHYALVVKISGRIQECLNPPRFPASGNSGHIT